MERFDINNGRVGLSSVETLYTHLQKVYVKPRRGEEKSKTLRVTVEIKSSSTISLGKVLSLQLTDDSDSTFFYSLLLSQEDFSVLKIQQGLLVDFDHFPSQLIKLFEACRSQELTKFILVLDEEDLVNQNIMSQDMSKDYVFLKVIETNNFKNLCHLSLKILQGSDTDIKNHMSLKISSLSEKLAEMEKELRVTEINLSETLKALENKSKELTEFQMKLTEEKNNIRLEASHQISEEREKLTKLQMEWQQKLELEKSQIVTQYQRQLGELNEQISLLTFNNKNLYEAKCQFETSVKEKMFRIETLEKQLLQETQEMNLLRKQNSQLDKDYHEKDKMVISLKTRLAVVEQELKDKEKFLDKQQELLRAANEQKSFLEEVLNEKESNLQKKQMAVQTLSADLMKSNEIIAKLQGDLAANKAKMKLRTDIALEQEKVLEKKTQQISAQTEAIKDLEEKLNKLSQELNSTTAHLQEANKKIEEKEAIIKKNDNVINWLNRRLTESTSSSRTGSDLMCSTSQPKGNISNLTKGWPPWLLNSVAGSNTSREESAGLSNVSNGIIKSSANSTPVEIQADSNKGRVPKLDENNQSEEKEAKTEDKRITRQEDKVNNSETRPKGLDPKYFQSCLDKEYASNPQILKAANAKDNRNTSNCKPTSRLNSSRQPVSAYFPKKPVPL